jgi:splicing factor 1
MTKTRLVKTVSACSSMNNLTITGGQIGHRKYDCPEQRNFTANIICRICGNAGHMARDCPDRARGSEWRNNDRGAPAGPGGPGGRPAAGRIGDAVDREYESLMQELSGGASAGPQHRIEAGPGQDGGYDNSGGAPWASGGGGEAAPWLRKKEDNAESGSGSAPWGSGGRQGGDQSQSYNNYGNQGYNQAAGSSAAAYGQWPAADASGQYQWTAEQTAAYAAYYQQYMQHAAAAAPGTASYYGAGAPPPPPGDAPPPPPPSGGAPPPVCYSAN